MVVGLKDQARHILIPNIVFAQWCEAMDCKGMCEMYSFVMDGPPCSEVRLVGTIPPCSYGGSAQMVCPQRLRRVTLLWRDFDSTVVSVSVEVSNDTTFNAL